MRTADIDVGSLLPGGAPKAAIITVCPFCLKSNFQLRRTRVGGRPWLYCYSCHARAFLGEDSQLATFALVVRLIADWYVALNAQRDQVVDKIMAGTPVDTGADLAASVSAIKEEANAAG